MTHTPTPTLVAIDGNSVFHRAWHAYNRTEMTDRNTGLPNFAMYGFWALVAGICDKTNPDGLVIGIDSRHNLRKDRCPEYKAQRSSQEDDFYRQFADTQAIGRELGICIAEFDGWEADDIIGSAAATATDAGWLCTIATSDRDAFQLISETTQVLRLGNGLDQAVFYDADVLVGKYGIHPTNYLTYAAMRGDTSDNLVGINGIGEKTAVKILDCLAGTGSTVADIAADPAAWKPQLGAAAAKVAGGIENFHRNIDIMAIDRTLPIDLASCVLDADPEATTSVLRKWSLPGLTGRLAVALGSTRAGLANAGPDHVPSGNQPSLFG